MKIYTKKGDDGTTGLYYGARVSKASPAPRAYGAVDEAQAFLGLARSAVIGNAELNELLIKIERDLWILMAELATEPENRIKLKPGVSLVTAEMVQAIETVIDDYESRFDMPKEFVVPGQSRESALFDVARTQIRRAERDCVEVAHAQSFVVQYLNRLSDLAWMIARYVEGTSLLARG